MGVPGVLPISTDGLKRAVDYPRSGRHPRPIEPDLLKFYGKPQVTVTIRKTVAAWFKASTQKD